MAIQQFSPRSANTAPRLSRRLRTSRPPIRTVTATAYAGHGSRASHNRRMTRPTNAFSKKWANHRAMLALTFAHYNFCRPHMTLTENAGRKTTPAMAAGLEQGPQLD
jgi:hypothetical protein